MKAARAADAARREAVDRAYIAKRRRQELAGYVLLLAWRATEAEGGRRLLCRCGGGARRRL